MKVITLFALLYIVSSHPTLYNLKAGETCDPKNPASIFSWHAHILFFTNNSEQLKRTLVLREKVFKRFPKIAQNACDNLFHNAEMCHFDVEDKVNEESPFVTGEWAVFFLPEHLNLIVPYLMQNRGEFSLLIHPNTGCQMEDHTIWAVWGGQSWHMNISIFGEHSTLQDRYRELLRIKNEQTEINVARKENFLNSPDTPEIVKKFLEEHEN